MADEEERTPQDKRAWIIYGVMGVLAGLALIAIGADMLIDALRPARGESADEP